MPPRRSPAAAPSADPAARLAGKSVAVVLDGTWRSTAALLWVVAQRRFDAIVYLSPTFAKSRLTRSYVQALAHAFGMTMAKEPWSSKDKRGKDVVVVGDSFATGREGGLDPYAGRDARSLIEQILASGVRLHPAYVLGEDGWWGSYRWLDKPESEVEHLKEAARDFGDANTEESLAIATVLADHFPDDLALFDDSDKEEIERVYAPWKYAPKVSSPPKAKGRKKRS